MNKQICQNCCNKLFYCPVPDQNNCFVCNDNTDGVFYDVMIRQVFRANKVYKLEKDGKWSMIKELNNQTLSRFQIDNTLKEQVCCNNCIYKVQHEVYDLNEYLDMS